MFRFVRNVSTRVIATIRERDDCVFNQTIDPVKRRRAADARLRGSIGRNVSTYMNTTKT